MQRILLFSLSLLAFSLTLTPVQAHAPINPKKVSSSLVEGCALPAPDWMVVTGTTGSSVSVAWSAVTGAALYRVQAHNLTQNITYPDVFTTALNYTQAGLNPGDVVLFEAAASACPDFPANESFREARAEGQAGKIVIEDIVHLGTPQTFNGLTTTVSLIPVVEGGHSVWFRRVKIEQGANGGTTNHRTMFNLWADCNYVVHLEPDYAFTNLYLHNLTSLTPSKVEYKVNEGNTALIRVFNPEVISETEVRVSLNFPSNYLIKQISPVITTTLPNACEVPSQLPMVVNENNSWVTESDELALETKDLSAQADLQQGKTTILGINPNPFTDQLQVNFELSDISAVTFSLINAYGQTVQAFELPEMEAGLHNLSVQTESLPNGLYYVALQTAEGRQIKTVIKQ